MSTPASPTKRGPTLDQLAHRYAPSSAQLPPSPDRLKRRLELAGRLAPDGTALSAHPSSTSVPPSPTRAEPASPRKNPPSLDQIQQMLAARRPGHSLALALADQRSALPARTSSASTTAAAPIRSPPASPTRLAPASVPAAAPVSTSASNSAPVPDDVPPPRPPSPVKPTRTNEGQVGPDGSVAHPLTQSWTLYFDSTSWNPSQASAASAAEAAARRLPYPDVTASSRAPAGAAAPVDRAQQGAQGHWAASLKNLGTFDTVEAFFGTFKSLRRPSSLSSADPSAGTGSSSYYLFKRGVTPAWEDRANAQGGRWTFTLPASNPALLDRSWTWLVLALIGEQLAPETVTEDEDDMDLVTGAVVTIRPGLHRLALWVRRYDPPSIDALNRLARKAVEVMDLASVPGVRVQFTPHAKPASWTNGKDAFWSLVTPDTAQAEGAKADQAGSWRSSK